MIAGRTPEIDNRIRAHAPHSISTSTSIRFALRRCTKRDRIHANDGLLTAMGIQGPVGVSIATSTNEHNRCGARTAAMKEPVLRAAYEFLSLENSATLPVEGLAGPPKNDKRQTADRASGALSSDAMVGHPFRIPDLRSRRLASRGWLSAGGRA